jgi:hypothetical protein
MDKAFGTYCSHCNIIMIFITVVGHQGCSLHCRAKEWTELRTAPHSSPSNMARGFLQEAAMGSAFCNR